MVQDREHLRRSVNRRTMTSSVSGGTTGKSWSRTVTLATGETWLMIDLTSHAGGYEWILGPILTNFPLPYPKGPF